MRILCRAAVISFKAAKLIVLLTLIKCFGSPGAACLLVGLAAIRDRVSLLLRGAVRATRFLSLLTLRRLTSAAVPFSGVAMNRQESPLHAIPDSPIRLLPPVPRSDPAALHKVGATGATPCGGDAADPDLARWEEEGGRFAANRSETHA